MSKDKAKKCCDAGAYECQVPMPIRGRRQDIDLCIADLVAALNAANIQTVASCCGHGKMPGSIALEDGRNITIADHYPAGGLDEPCNQCFELSGENDEISVEIERDGLNVLRLSNKGFISTFSANSAPCLSPQKGYVFLCYEFATGQRFREYWMYEDFRGNLTKGHRNGQKPVFATKAIYVKEGK